MKPAKLFHCTTPKKAAAYRVTGHIISPVRGFTTIEAALAWCAKTHRTVILEVSGWSDESVHKLPDHHNKFGCAFWVDENVKDWCGAFNADSDA